MLEGAVLIAVGIWLYKKERPVLTAAAILLWVLAVVLMLVASF